MPDRELAYKISTPADLAGAQAAQLAFQGIAQAATQAAGAEGGAAAATGRFTDAAGRLREANGQFVSLGKAAGDAAREIGNAGHATDGFLGFLKQGVAIDFGHRIVEGVSELPRLYTEALTHGVEYLAEMQTRTIGLGAALRGARPDLYLDFSQARAAGAEALDLLYNKANALGVPFHSLAETFSITVPTLVESGITKMSDQIDVISRFGQLAQSKGLSGAQAMRDIIDELTGRGERTIFGRELDAMGLTKEAMERAKANGTEAQLILEKSSAYAESAAASADSYAGSLNTIHNELDKLEGQLAKPIFEQLIGLLQGGKGGLGGTGASGIASGLGDTLGGVFDDVKRMAEYVESTPWLKAALTQSVQQGLPPTVGVQGTLLSGLIGNIEGEQGNAEVDANIKQVSTLRDKIAHAKTDQEIAEARKALEEAIAEASHRTAEAQGDARDRAEQFLVALKAINSSFKPGTAKPGDDTADEKLREKRVEEAQRKYDESPKARLGAAEASGDPDAAEQAKFDAARAKRAQELEKEGQTPDQANFNAGYELSAAANLKADQEQDKADDRAAKKAEADKKRDDEQKQRDDQEAERNAKQRADSLADVQVETAILEKRASGDKEGADALEKKRDIQREIVTLMERGATYAEAEAAATRLVNAQNAASDRKAEDRPSRAERRRSGRERDGFTIQGYSSGGDQGSGLTTGGLTTGSLGGGLPLTDASWRTFGDPAAALAAAPTYVPTFPSAAQALGPTINSSGLSLASGVQSGGTDPLSAAAAKLGGAADSGTAKTAQAMDKLSEVLGRGFGELHAKLNQLSEKVEQDAARNANAA